MRIHSFQLFSVCAKATFRVICTASYITPDSFKVTQSVFEFFSQ